jgi:hypothetical protein
MKKRQQKMEICGKRVTKKLIGCPPSADCGANSDAEAFLN